MQRHLWLPRSICCKEMRAKLWKSNSKMVIGSRDCCSRNLIQYNTSFLRSSTIFQDHYWTRTTHWFCSKNLVGTLHKLGSKRSPWGLPVAMHTTGIHWNCHAKEGRKYRQFSLQALETPLDLAGRIRKVLVILLIPYLQCRRYERNLLRPCVFL